MRTLLRRLAPTAVVVSLMLAGATSTAGADGTSTVVSPGLNTTGATVTSSDGTSRTVSSTDAAAMMQPLVSSMYFGTPSFTEPPAGATRSTIVFGWQFTAQPPPESGKLTVAYAQQGTTGWVALPPQVLWPGATIPEENADRWFVIGTGFVQAFDGQGTPQTFVPDSSSDGTPASTSSSSGSVVVVILAAAAVVILGLIWSIRRRSTNG